MIKILIIFIFSLSLKLYPNAIYQYQNAFESQKLHDIESQYSVSNDIVIQSLSYQYLDPDYLNQAIERFFPSLSYYIDQKTKTLFFNSSSIKYSSLNNLITIFDQPIMSLIFESKIIEITQGIDQYLDTYLTTLGSGINVKIKTLPEGLKLISNIDFELNYLKTIASANIIAQPTLMTLDGHPATIHIGDKIPYLSTVIQQNASLEQVHFIDSGIDIRFTPHLLENGLIKLDLDISISSVQVWKQLMHKKYPVLSQRHLESSIIIKSGQPLVIGGLVQEKINYNKTPFPIIEYIPLINRIFRNRQKDYIKTDILIMITCKIKKKALE